MRIRLPAINSALGVLASHAVRTWMDTQQVRAAYYQNDNDPAFPSCRRRRLYLFWHEYILLPLHLRGYCHLAMLLSRHRDADMLSTAARRMGFQFVRGSTNRGGVAAIRQLLEKSRAMHLTITPDGPRGPRRQLSPGCVFLASRLRIPIVLLGIGFDRPWRTPTWDRFAIPRPYRRARCILSGDIDVPPDLDRHGIEHYRGRIETLLTRLSNEAEAWAVSGRRVEGEMIPAAGPARGVFAPVPPCSIFPPAPDEATAAKQWSVVAAPDDSARAS